MKRQHLEFSWYDKRHYKIPIPNKSWWFHDARGSFHCVATCFNQSDVFYISDKGLASIAYCEAHARSKVLHTMLTGDLERGVWCTIYQRKLQPHWFYKHYMEYLKKSNPKQAEKLENKIKLFKKFLHIKGTSIQKTKQVVK